MSLNRPKFLIEWLEIRRQGGFKLLLKKKGWKVILAIVVYYLIRDTILYIIIPYYAFTSMKGCF